MSNPEQDMCATEIPQKCQVLVIGGGPGGSYAASALSREGIDVVLLEADGFPRYHIGESMLASMRHFLRFIDLDTKFDAYGFTKKVGAAFKLNGQKREGFTDFLAAGGPENYAWNVVRSEADDLMFRHAGECGTHIFDRVKVTEISFEPVNSSASPDAKCEYSGKRPVSASWIRKGPSSTPSSDPENENSSKGEKKGTIAFDYLVDASGRAGILNTRYLKNRTYNQGLKNVASWGYWRDAGVYACGTERENVPFFEALKDESGWAWLIPLHNGTTSVGIVMNQEIATAKRKAVSPSPSSREFYLEQLKLAPSLLAILHSEPATLISDIKSASDYSYSSSSYSLPNARIVGDAGCFIDPYFSSGVHLALTSALSAATTICASLRGDCEEKQAARWHDVKVGTSYTRFLMVVLSAYRQIRRQTEPVLADFDEDNFDRAFAFFRPIIQGTADVNSKLSQDVLSKTLDFCAHAFEPTLPEDREAVLKKLNGSASKTISNGHTKGHANGLANGHTYDKKSNGDINPEPSLSEEDIRILRHIRAREMMRTEDTMHVGSFYTDVIDGYIVRGVRGSLGLRKLDG
ncbi:FAD/NAD-binding domain-containing protein [Fomitiporia mediterranea MF3/22]|uniref:FAD/NAD-binding domain-containing protein n=1 Tax=Fomitiporia mediterranea (strain MF3/22) TaxID=694068 RepID=UPI00044095C0|nr:FAD/NAD-binding domain-containing protein [Fomitiporia mediterranea MF3/22]EJD07853.1 FAD/NAD-binding domain-containing protein [Fomitiporia mediterranea MF3/22]